MNAVQVLQNSVDALVRPLGPEPARLLMAALAVVFFALLARGVWRKDIGVFRTTIGLAVVAFFGALAWDLKLLSYLERISYLARIRWVMGVLSFVVLLVTFEAVRRSHLRERYALLWVSTGIMLMLCAVFTDVLDFFCALLGMQYVTFVVTVIFIFLLLVSFHFSIALSALGDDRSRLAQRCAHLETRVAELERATRSAGRPSQPPEP